MIGKKMQEALNQQINEELYSSYLYLAMSAYFEAENLRGFAHWMQVQAREENSHAHKLYHYLFERGGRVTLKAIAEPQAAWDNPLAAFKAAYKHEQHITGCINDLVGLSRSEKDYATEVFLQWFVKEQVEEEAHADEIVQMLKMIGEAKHGLFMADRQLAGRKDD